NYSSFCLSNHPVHKSLWYGRAQTFPTVFCDHRRGMNRCWVVLLLLSLYSSDAYKFLVYSPLFGYSHTNFMGAIADTLTEAGHDVFLCCRLFSCRLWTLEEGAKTGVKLTKKIIKTPIDPRVEEMMRYKSIMLSHMWTMQPSIYGLMQMAKNMTASFTYLCERR
ncbi:hypothetical protein OSTOST_24272, partial [Ostertagia ostertagi]